jgi:hypothetical protein
MKFNSEGVQFRVDQTFTAALLTKREGACNKTDYEQYIDPRSESHGFIDTVQACKFRRKPAKAQASAARHCFWRRVGCSPC